jgi:integrase
MPRPKKHTSPGFIFPRGNKLYIKLKLKQYRTGLNNTKEGWELAEQMKDKMYVDYLLNNNLLPTVEQHKTVYETFAGYISKLKSKNRSHNTIRGYELALRSIVPNDILLEIKDIKQAVNDFLSNRGDLTDASRNIYLHKFQIFLNYCIEEEYISKIDVYKKNMVDVKSKEVEPYTDKEFATIINAIEHPESKIIKPDREFSLLLYYMKYYGSRITEALKLLWAQVDFTKSLITLPNKINTKKDDYIPINKYLKPILIELKKLPKNRNGSDKKEKVFRWEPSSSSRLTRRLTEIEKVLKLKIDKQSFHRIRNTFSNKLYSSKKLSESQINDLMRHKDPRTGRKHYKKYNSEPLREAINELNL